MPPPRLQLLAKSNFLKPADKENLKNVKYEKSIFQHTAVGAP